MSKKKDVLDFTTQVPLIDRQRILLAHSEAIELAMKKDAPLPTEVSEWLYRALKRIACGEDANAVFDVVGVKTERRDALKAELFHKHAVGFIASKTQQDTESATVLEAIEMFTTAVPSNAASTIRKKYNSSTTDRSPTYTLTKK